MKKLILLFGLSIFLFSCGDNSSEIEELKKMNKELSDKLNEFIKMDTVTVLQKEDLSSQSTTREKICERYDNGDKKVICFYKGIGVNEISIKKIHYYQQNNGGRQKIIENFNNDGKLHGDYISWHSNGEIKIETTYNNGERDGTYTLNWSDGGTKEEGIYENGVPIGIWKEYYDSQQIQRIITYDSRGDLEDYKLYDDDDFFSH